MTHWVFISYGWHDRWIASQMSRLVSAAGAEPFIDIYDIASRAIVSRTGSGRSSRAATSSSR